MSDRLAATSCSPLTVTTTGPLRRGYRSARRALAVALLSLILTGCAADGVGTQASDVSTPAPAATASTSPSSAADGDTAAQVAQARAMLDGLRVGGRSAGNDYDREGHFGPRWADVDGNGCGTRDDILERDLTEESKRSRCVVVSGLLEDPYTGRSMAFDKADASAVQIDHVVPLKLAYVLGADTWAQGKRVAFANDPVNLLAVDGPANMQKSASGPDAWLPPNKSYRCTYVIRFTRVLAAYELRVTSPMKDMVVRQLDSCSQVVGTPASLEPLPQSSWDRAGRLGGGSQPAAPQQPAEQPAAPPAGGNDLIFSSCNQAKSAGYGPYRQGVDPEYDSYRDGDSDGTVCE